MITVALCPKGSTIEGYLLGFDQAGSLKAVASQDPDGGLRVVKVVDYDSFGNILSDSNPNLFLPLGFAGGLRDRFTGLVRFCHRDYDPTVGRFTAPDPLGDTGGDHDPYDYCVDEPVGAFDPSGLVSENVQKAEEEFHAKQGRDVAEQASELNTAKQDEDDFSTRAKKGLSGMRGLEDYGDGMDSSIDWDSGENGRNTSDGPRYGNWGGKNWSGGRNPAEHGNQDGGKAPVDSSDELYKDHDICTGAAKGSPGEEDRQRQCDDTLVNGLKKLPKNPKDWPKPPREGDEEDAGWFRDKATWWFTP